MAKSFNKALFLDRDGVLINYIPYLSDPGQVTLPAGAGQALQQWQQAGYELVIVTNQAGIGRGYYSEADFWAVQSRLIELYHQQGITFTKTYFCPHTPWENCRCRKPQPGMLQQAAEDLGLTLKACYFVGDAPSDLQAAISAGCQPVLVLTGRGHETAAQLTRWGQPIPVFSALSEIGALLNQS